MAENACCRIAPSAEGYVVTLLGPGTLNSSPAFREFVSQSLQNGLRVVVDLESCDYLDSTFLGCLIGLHKQSLSLDGMRFQVLANSTCQMRLLATSGLHQLLNFADERPPTMGGFVSLELTELDQRSLGQHVMHAHRMLAHLGGKDAEKFRAIADRLQQELDRSSSN